MDHIELSLMADSLDAHLDTVLQRKTAAVGETMNAAAPHDARARSLPPRLPTLDEYLTVTSRREYTADEAKLMIEKWIIDHRARLDGTDLSVLLAVRATLERVVLEEAWAR